MESCSFTTDRRRKRPEHLLVVHGMIFQGMKRPPALPTSELELQERLEAVRKRKRGQKQRAREKRREEAGAEGRVPVGVRTRPVVGPSSSSTPSTSPVRERLGSPAPMGDGAPFTPPVAVLSPVHTDTGEVNAVDVSDWEEDFFPDVADEVGADLDDIIKHLGDAQVQADPCPAEWHYDWVVAIPTPQPPSTPHLAGLTEFLPRCLPEGDFVQFVAGIRDLGYQQAVLRVQQHFGVADDDLPRLRLAVQLVWHARRQLIFDVLGELASSLQGGATAEEAVIRLASTLATLATL